MSINLMKNIDNKLIKENRQTIFKKFFKDKNNNV